MMKIKKDASTKEGFQFEKKKKKTGRRRAVTAGALWWCVECNDPFLASAGHVSDVVQRADLRLNLELQLLIFDFNVSAT